ncbi:peptidase domain-containing ABC transporter [Enterococcus plantarum]|uniref:peptidase domain-containing ABC transporter n=1 Tax=Enterococcus plantarum TaxID=1077675 RepID=UPI001F5F8FA5|nr:peptidase domain-containing ABC transporter [Enterococcus plantarum]
MSVIQQMEHSECGLAVAAMFISYFKKDVSLVALRSKYGVPVGGLNLYQINLIIKDYNIDSKVVRVKDDKVLNILPAPFIAYVKNSHFVIVEKVHRNSIMIIDPAFGRVKYKYTEFLDIFSNVVLFTDEKKKKRNEKNEKNEKIISIIKKNRKALISTFFITFLSQLIATVIPISMRSIIDDNNKLSINQLVTVLLSFTIAFYSINALRRLIITKLQIAFDYDLTSETIVRILALPLKFFVNRSSGELIFRVNSNSFIKNIISDKIISVGIDFIFTLFYILLMLYYSPKLTILTLIIASMIVFSSFISSKMIYKVSQNQIISVSDSQNVVSEIISSISTIKSVSAEEKMFMNWDNKIKKSIFFERQKGRYAAFISTVPLTLQILYPLLIIVSGLYLFQNEDLSLGTIIAFSSLGAGFLSPLASLSSSYTEILLVKVYLSKLIDILDSDEEDSLNLKDMFLLEKGNISIKNVSFKYDLLSKNILNDINLEISDGEKIAIVGPSGSGKSTLIKLLTGLYLPNSGEIEVSNKNLKEYLKHSYRKQLGIVMQDSDIFSGSIRDNILMGRKFTDEEILKTANKINLLELIEKYPSGLNTLISENGQNFSGGQKQRIAICRAMIGNPRIMVFDEPTSFLDNISENVIMDSIFKNKTTVVVVAHRLSNINKFDKVILMNNGTIEDMGSHSELLLKNDIYKKLILKK